jgi:threonine/homoserine/homoserine lactone efflux protein
MFVISLLGQYITADTYMVEMVLLGMPRIMVLVWIGCVTVWRYTGTHYRNSNSGRICQGLLRF